MKKQIYPLPNAAGQRDVFLEVSRFENVAIHQLHWTSTHAENAGCYLIETVMVEFDQ